MYRILFLFLLPVLCLADLYWTSPTGSANWASAKSTTPLTGASCTDIITAFQSATAGDTVYMREGTYDLGSTYPNNYVETANDGTSGNRILVTSYNSESVTITSDVSESVGADHGAVVNIRNEYWTISYITMIASDLGSKEGAAVLMVGYIGTGNYLYVHHCTLEVQDASGNSFQGVIELFGDGNIFEDNEIIGINNNECIQQWASSGARIKNNVIHGGRDGIFYKHPNCDTALSDSAQIAYNYIYNHSRLSVCGNFSYVNIHDNIMNNGFRVGDDGGSQVGCTTRLGSILNHNTIIGTLYDYGDITYTMTATNNIVTGSLSGVDTEMMTLDYNMYGSSAAVGAHDQGNTSPTFIGGSTPSNSSGFELDAGSDGVGDGNDAKDLGADISAVGIDSQPSENESIQVSQKKTDVSSVTEESN